MKLYIARHGRTQYNDLGLCNGDPSVSNPLTGTGEQQAKALGEKLKHAAIQHIYVSEMKRTQQTAAFANVFHNAAITIEPRLNDIRTGYEGKHFTEYNAALEKAPNRYTARFNGGESIEDVKARIQSFVRDLRGQQYETVLIVTSEVIVQAFCAVLQDISNEAAEAITVEQGSFLEFDLR
ncbi:MAG TPA: histidine phosphatase family protein [Candidatus Saccharimonadales bacterium]|nr:histidine phosphatase family protein [Candidatus Saccharimonadales bacterium]